MKKIIKLLSLLIVIIPSMVFAATSAYIDPTAASTTTDSDGNEIKVYNIYIKTTESESVVSETINFTFGDKVNSITCLDANDFMATTTGNTCTFEDPLAEGKTGEQVLIGQVKVVTKKTGSDSSVSYVYNNTTQKINPNTGAEVSYIALILLAFGAFAIYNISYKKNKIASI